MSSLKNSINITYLQTAELKLYSNTVRKFGKKQIEKLKRLVEESGFIVPLIIDKDRHIIIGYALYEAAKQMGIDEVPVVIAEHLDEASARKLRIAYDRIAEEETWDKEGLSAEFRDLLKIDLDMDLTITGFEPAEIDLMIDFDGAETAKEDIIPPATDGPTVCQTGDLWALGQHRILCSDSLQESSYSTLMAGEKAQLAFEDPPYNCPVDKHVCGLGSIRHTEFAMASGEMSDAEFSDMLERSYRLKIAHLIDGAIIFSCMDWRNAALISLAAARADLEHKNTCVWVKDNGGMGSLYRSGHEFVFVFKYGKSPHINNVELGKHGRYRTNVWEFPGVNTMRKGRLEDLAMHPTVKPTALVAEAIKDCSRRNDIVLDPFGGSGTTLIACEKTGRRARLIEIEPKYVDVTIRRWQDLTGKKAVLASTGQTFDEIALRTPEQIPHTQKASA